MSVTLFIITHQHVGQVLLDTTINMLGNCPLTTHIFEVPSYCNPDTIYQQGMDIISQINMQQGVLILTDIYGSTPSNIASRLAANKNIAIISGINLPMLVRVMNYPDLPLPRMVHKAFSGGHEGIIHCNPI